MTFMIVTLLISIVTAQDGMDDAGADMDLESMMGGDTAGMDENPALVKQVVEKSFLEETTLALQQLGLIIGEILDSKKANK
jgi:hypothetical protein